MKRPFAVIGFTSLVTALLLVYSASAALAAYCAVISATGLILSLVIKSGRINAVSLLCIGCLSASLVMFFAEGVRADTVACCGENKEIEAVVCESPEFSHEKGRYYVTARLDTVSGERKHGKIRLSFSETYDEISSSDLKIGDRISFRAYTYKIGADSKDINLYFASTGVFIGGYSVEELKIEAPSFRSLSYYVDLLRDKIFEITISSFPNKSGGLIIAMLTGDKNHIDGELYNAFKKSGTAHLLAVSGMHLSVWIMFLTLILGDKIKRKWYANLLLAVSVVFIMFIAAFSPSVMRAGIMCLVTILGKHISRESDGLNSLGFASAVMLFYNPYLAVNVGFQLSFLSVLAIFTLAVPFSKSIEDRYCPKIPNEVLQKLFSVAVACVAISLSVTLFTFPVLALSFGGASVVSPLTNLLLMPVSSPIVILSGLNALLHNIPVLSTAISVILNFLCEYSIFVVEKTSALFFSYLPYSRESFVFWCVIFTIVLAGVLLFMKKRLDLRKYTSAAIAVAFLVAACSYTATSFTSYSIVYVSESSYIAVMNGRGVLVGIGDDYYYESKLSTLLDEKNIKLDAVVQMTDDDDARLGYICFEYGIDYVLDNPGDKITLFDCASVENRGDYAIISGNGVQAAVFSNNGLQHQGEYDIIIDSYGLVISDGVTSNYSLTNEDYSGFFVTVNNKGKINYRGEIFG